MTESQSDAAYEAPLASGPAEVDPTTVPDPEATQTIRVMAPAWRGSVGRNQWVPSPWEESGKTADPNPAGPRRVRIGKKSAWALGGTGAIIVAVAALAGVSLSSGGSSRTGAPTALSSVSPRASALPVGRPLASASGFTSLHRARGTTPSASSPKAAETPTSSAAAAPTQVPVNSTSALPSAATPAPAATGPGAAGTNPTSATQPATVSVPEPVGWWYLNDDNTTSTAVDAMGVHTATGSNTAWCNAAANGNCATFNGTSSQFTTSGPVLDTAPGSSFTVAAAVFMTAFTPNNAFETIVSQDGVYDSGFYLQYSASDHRWAFARVTEDTDNGPPGIRALSTSAPSLNTWTELVGVFDASDNQLRLYVNGVLEGTATDTSPFAATGPLAIGRAQFDGQPTDWFEGSANQIKVYNVALTAAQVDQI
jgi:Concanavalin A-like lectin/glucanases superfamily